MRDYTSLARQAADETAAMQRYHKERAAEAKRYQEQADAILEQFVGLPCRGQWQIAKVTDKYERGIEAREGHSSYKTRIHISCGYDKAKDRIVIEAYAHTPYDPYGGTKLGTSTRIQPDEMLDEVAYAVAEYIGKQYLKAETEEGETK